MQQASGTYFNSDRPQGCLTSADDRCSTACAVWSTWLASHYILSLEPRADVKKVELQENSCLSVTEESDLLHCSLQSCNAIAARRDQRFLSPGTTYHQKPSTDHTLDSGRRDCFHMSMGSTLGSQSSASLLPVRATGVRFLDGVLKPRTTLFHSATPDRQPLER